MTGIIIYIIYCAIAISIAYLLEEHVDESDGWVAFLMITSLPITLLVWFIFWRDHKNPHLSAEDRYVRSLDAEEREKYIKTARYGE